MAQWKSMKQCPQCKAQVKQVEDTGVRYQCGSLIHIIGVKAGTLTSTGTCATNGRTVFDEWADSQIKSRKRGTQ